MRVKIRTENGDQIFNDHEHVLFVVFDEGDKEVLEESIEQGGVVSHLSGPNNSFNTEEEIEEWAEDILTESIMDQIGITTTKH